MIDRNGGFSPKENEQSVGGSDRKSSPLTEMTFMAHAKEQMDVAQDTNDGIGDLVGMFGSGKVSVKVSNFRSGITNPIMDFIEMDRDQQKATDTRRHKENILYQTQIRRSIERSADQQSNTMANTVRETYYNMTKSVLSMISTVITPVIKGFGAILFGGGKKKRSATEAIDEQTQFMRTGMIQDSSSFIGRFMRRGLVGGALAGLASAGGMGRGAAQSAEEKRARGEERNLRERLVTSMNVQMGWFRDFDRRDTRRTFQPDHPELQQVDMLEQMKTANAGLLGEVKTASDELSKRLFDIYFTIDNQTVKLINAIDRGIGNVVGVMESAFVTLMGGYREIGRESNEEVSYYSARQNQLLTDTVQELQEANKNMVTAHEYRILELERLQYEELLRMNELATEYQKGQKSGNGGGGMFGMLSGLVSGLLGGRVSRMVARYGKRFIVAPLLGTFGAIAAWFKTKGIFTKATGAKILGAAKKYIVSPVVGAMKGLSGWLKKNIFNKNVARSIARFGKRYIISPVMGAIRSGGSWISRNGFKLLLRLPFAKVFAVVGITSLLYKYLARPMIDWFDDTFQTDIGGSIDRFGNFVSEKFNDMLGWIREQMAKVPVIGKYFDVEKAKEEGAAQGRAIGGMINTAGNAFMALRESLNTGSIPGQSIVENIANNVMQQRSFSPVTNNTKNEQNILDMSQQKNENYSPVGEQGTSRINETIITIPKGQSGSDSASTKNNETIITTPNRQTEDAPANANEGSFVKAFGGVMNDFLNKLNQGDESRRRERTSDPEPKYSDYGLNPIRTPSQETNNNGIFDMSMQPGGNIGGEVSGQVSGLTEQINMLRESNNTATQEQVRLMKEQKKEQSDFNNTLVDLLFAVADNTQQGAMATYMNTKAQQVSARMRSSAEIEEY